MKLLKRLKPDRHGNKRRVIYWNVGGKQHQLHVDDLSVRVVDRLIKIANMDDDPGRQRWLIKKTPALKFGGTSDLNLTASILLHLKELREKKREKRKLALPRKRPERRLPKDEFGSFISALDKRRLTHKWKRLKLNRNYCVSGHLRPEFRDILAAELKDAISELETIRAELGIQ